MGTAARRLNLLNANELLARMGSTEVTGDEVVETIYPGLFQKSNPDIVEPAKMVIGLPEGHRPDIAPCCKPVPGERIIGIPTRRNGVTVHAFDCGRLGEMEEQSDWLDLRWHPGPYASVHPVTMEVTVANRPSVLGRVCMLIGEQNANISDLRFIDRKPDYYRMLVDLEVQDNRHLHDVMISIEADSDVAGISRYRHIGAASTDAARGDFIRPPGGTVAV